LNASSNEKENEKPKKLIALRGTCKMTHKVKSNKESLPYSGYLAYLASFARDQKGNREIDRRKNT
jgi:hypothetical protein